jgi:hypothetical protein
MDMFPGINYPTIQLSNYMEARHTMNATQKTRENRLRRKLSRMGYRLTRSRRRDPQAWDYGGYMIVDIWSGGVVAGAVPHAYSLTLSDVEEWARDGEPNKPKQIKHEGR